MPLRSPQSRTSTRAFSLIELLLVIAIIGVLAALLLPVLSKGKERSLTVKCVEQLRQMGLAMILYADEHQELLPAAHGVVPWNNTSPPPWTRPLLPYYSTTNVLCCPAFSRVYQHSPFSYFMGARGAFIEAGGQAASVALPRLQLPAHYIVSGDCNFPFQQNDADPDNYTQDALFGSASPSHGGRVNVLFADGHTQTASRFDPKSMTYSYSQPGVDWNF